ncbi:MAG: benzoyl-CoA reductase subunit C [Myxococcaceae bacterium]|nr:benzoyl-CoA reductase subunit C [Myxococcaceae bacterium]
MASAPTATELLERCERLFADTALDAVRAWKAAHPGRLAIGHLPVYAPRELIHAAGALPVALQGGGDQVDIVKGDACFQSYICHLPRSTVELGLTGDLDVLDGFVFPSTCDVIRNLSGIWKLLFPQKYARFLDLPQAFDASTGGRFYRHDLEELGRELHGLGGLPPDDGRLRASIALYDDNRRAIEKLYALRRETPWLCSSDEAFLLVKAGGVLDVQEHTALLRAFIDAAGSRPRKREDRIRLLLIGAFCEQPPLGVLRTLEKSGAYVVDDDLNLGARWLEGDVGPSQRPLEALVRAYLEQSTWASTRFEHDEPRGAQLVKRVRRAGADGVVFAAPSFCDPALLDQPPLQKALTEAGVPFFSFKYAENTGQFQGIREQAGTFSDSLKLWGAA